MAVKCTAYHKVKKKASQRSTPSYSFGGWIENDHGNSMSWAVVLMHKNISHHDKSSLKGYLGGGGGVNENGNSMFCSSGGDA